MKGKPIVCVDFDGVLNNYTGWKGEHHLYEPRVGAGEFLEMLSSKFVVYVFTTRNRDKVIGWLEKNDLIFFVDEVTDIKVGAVAYIDDRAIQFNGDYQECLDKLINFKAYWEE